MSTTGSLINVPETFTFEQYRLMGLQEQHAEVDGARAVISLSYTATALRYGIPLKIETGKFRPRKGDPITICPQSVINDFPWKKYKRIYVPQHDHSFLSRAFSLVYIDYCDFLMRFYTARYQNPSPEVHQQLLLLSQITVIEKVFKEKYAEGMTAFACPFVYRLLQDCYYIRNDYSMRRKAIYTAAKKHHWDEVTKEHLFIQAREKYQTQAERLRQIPLPIPLESLPLGVPKIVLLGQGGDHASV